METATRSLPCKTVIICACQQSTIEPLFTLSRNSPGKLKAIESSCLAVPHQISRSTHQNPSFKHEKCGVTKPPIYIHDADSLQTDGTQYIHSAYYVDKTRRIQTVYRMPTQSATTSRYKPARPTIERVQFHPHAPHRELSCKSEGSGRQLAGGMPLTQSISHGHPTYQERRIFGIASSGTEKSQEGS